MRWPLVFLIVGCNAAGDLLNTAGMRRHGEVHDLHPRALLRLVPSLARNPLVIGGVIAMAVAFFGVMALFSIAPLSFAVPATAVSYVVETFLAKYVLGEHIHPKRWLGVVIVTSGVVLLAM